MSQSEREKSRQCVHVKMDKVVYNELRVLLFKKNLFLQELLEEFIRRVVDDDIYATHIVEALLQKKLDAKMTKKKRKQKNKDRLHKEFIINEHDTEMLYKLIEASSGDIQRKPETNEHKKRRKN